MASIIVLPPADDLHGVVAIQLTVARLLMDVQILIGVVVVHVKGDIKVHAAQSVHQVADGLPLHQNIEVRCDAGDLGHLLPQGLHALSHPLTLGQVGGTPVPGIHRVNALAGGAGVDHSVSGHIQALDGLVVGVVGEQQNGVRGPTGHVPSCHQEGIDALLAPATGNVGHFRPVEGQVGHAVSIGILGKVGQVRYANPSAEHRPHHNHNNGQNGGHLQTAVTNPLSTVQSGHPILILLPIPSQGALLAGALPLTVSV